MYNTEKSKSADHIIFRNYLTGMKIVVRQNFDFQYSQNFLYIRFFGIRHQNISNKNEEINV